VPLEKSDIKLYAANGTEIANLGNMLLRYHLEGMTLQTELVVSDEIDELIFGYDCLVAHKCRWHFKERTVSVHGRPVSLHTRPCGTDCRQRRMKKLVATRPGRSPNRPGPRRVGTAVLCQLFLAFMAINKQIYIFIVTGSFLY